MENPRIPRDYKYLAVPDRKTRNRYRIGSLRAASTLARRHPYKLAGATTCILVLGLWVLAGASGGSVPEVMESRSLEIPEPAITSHEPVAREPEWREHEVRPGETLAQIFSQLNLTPRDVHRVVHLDANTRRLSKLYPGDRLRFRLNEDGSFHELEFEVDEATRVRVTETEDGLVSHLVPVSLVREVREASGVIRDSFFLAGQEAGLTDALIMEVAHLFGWDIDFILDIRSGDSFQVIYEEVIRDGEFVRTGNILAATFVNQGRKVQAIRFESEDGVGYYSPDGRNIKKTFLRAPLNFSYVSSHFNPRRLHPILNRVKSHNGIDYRAPSGTPVMAAGDGRVIRSSYGKYNGHHVFIEHPNGVVTKYLHFSRRTVNKGARVSQGDIIGYVGSTGLATASHLHYEFIVNGVHRNPATVDLPKADPLPAAQLALFQDRARPYLAQLDRLAASQLLATAE